MAHERQKMIRKELERIPRGLKGSPQINSLVYSRVSGALVYQNAFQAAAFPAQLDFLVPGRRHKHRSRSDNSCGDRGRVVSFL